MALGTDQRGKAATGTLDALIGPASGIMKYSSRRLQYRLDLMACVTVRQIIQQTGEGVLDLAADHVHIRHGQLRFNVRDDLRRLLRTSRTSAVAERANSSAFGALTRGERVIGVRLQHLLVRRGGTGVIALLRQLVRFLMLRRHHVGTSRRTCASPAPAPSPSAESGSPEYGAVPFTPACCGHRKLASA